MIGRLLYHTHVQTTDRYANLANDSVKASGFSMGDSIGMHIATSEPSRLSRRPVRQRRKTLETGFPTH